MCARAMDSSRRGVTATLSGCRSILRLAGTAVHTGLSPVATQVSGRSPVWLSRARRGALSGGWIAVSVDNVRSLVCGFERRRCTPPGTWRRSKCWYSSARSWMREECSWRLSSPGQRPLRSASGSAGVEATSNCSALGASGAIGSSGDRIPIIREECSQWRLRRSYTRSRRWRLRMLCSR